MHDVEQHTGEMVCRTEIVARNLQAICVGDKFDQVCSALVDVAIEPCFQLRPSSPEHVDERDDVAAVLTDIGDDAPLFLRAASRCNDLFIQPVTPPPLEG